MTEIEISLTDARRKFHDLLSVVEREGSHVTITRYGTPAAAIVPARWYQQVRGAADPLTREDPIQPLSGADPFTGEVRFTASTDLLMRLLEEAYRRVEIKTADAGRERREALNAILVEALSIYLDREASRS